MLKKLMAALRNGPGTNEVLDKIIGLFLFIVIFSMVYLAGFGDGRNSEETDLSNLAQLQVKIDRIQQSIDSNRSCTDALPNNARSEQVQ